MVHIRLYIVRNIFLAISFIFSICLLGLCAHWTQGTLDIGIRHGRVLDHVNLNFEIVGLIAGSYSLIFIGALLGVSLLRKNATFLAIKHELPILLIAWVLWMVTSILVTEWTSIFYPFGRCVDLDPTPQGFCQEFFAIKGLTTATWVILLSYFLLVFILALQRHFKGRPIWSLSMKEVSAAISTNTQTTRHENVSLGPASLQAKPNTLVAGVPQLDHKNV